MDTEVIDRWGEKGEVRLAEGVGRGSGGSGVGAAVVGAVVVGAG